MSKLEELEGEMVRQEDEFHGSVASAAALVETNAELQQEVSILVEEMERLQSVLEVSQAKGEELSQRLTAELVDRGLATAAAMVCELKAEESYNESMEKIRMRLTSCESSNGRDSVESWGSWGSMTTPTKPTTEAAASVDVLPTGAPKVLDNLATLSAQIWTGLNVAPIIVVDSFTPDRTAKSGWQAPETPQATVDALPCIIVEHSARTSAMKDESTSPMVHSVATTPIKATCAEATTSPRSPLVDFLAITQGQSPQTLLDQIESVTISNELLREQHTHLTNEVARKNVAIAALEEDIDFAASELEACQSGSELHEEAVGKMGEELNLKAVEINHLKSEFDDLQQNVSQLQERADQATALTFDNDYLRAELDRTEKLATDQAETMQQATLDQNQHLEQTAALMETHTSVQKTLKEQQEVNQRLSTDLQMLDSKNKAEMARLVDIQKGDPYREQYTELLSENKQLRTTITHIKGCFDELQATSDLQQCASTELNTIHSGAVENLKAAELQMKHLTEELSSLQESQIKLRAEIDLRQAQSEDEQTQKTFALAELESLRESQAALGEELEAAHANTQLVRADRLKGQAELEARCAVLTTQLESTTTQYNEITEFAEEERLVRSEVIEDMERDMAAVQSESEQLQVTLAERTEMVAACKEELDSVVAQAAAELAAASEEADLVRLKMEDCHLEGVQQSTQVVEELQLELQAKSSMIEELGGELCSKELEVVEIEQTLKLLQASRTTTNTAAIKTQEEMQANFLSFKVEAENFKQQAELKIGTLRDNLVKAEAEVTFLDGELTKLQQVC
jgi:chromosome segregation ATPase